MNRRSFLKGLAVGLPAVALGVGLAPRTLQYRGSTRGTWSGGPAQAQNLLRDGKIGRYEGLRFIDLENEQGELLRISNRISPAGIHRVEEFLHSRARRALPVGTAYEIRVKIPTDFGRNRGMAWYTSPEVRAQLPVEQTPYPGRVNYLGGYMSMGTHYV